MPADTSVNAGNPSGDFVIALDCPDRPGIVHAVSGFLVDHCIDYEYLVSW